MLIETGTLKRNSLKDKIAIVTGAGGGIGYEACRSLIWLGSKVIIAEINPKTGQQSAQKLNQEFGSDMALFIRTDIGDENSVKNLARQLDKTFGKVDIVINNATIAEIGAVKDLDIKAWDTSYRVNLRGPVLLARSFIPGMIKRNSGVFICVSSVGLAYMGAYETIKAAQVHLSVTLNDELENTGVAVFSIGPGFVPTQTAVSGISKLAALMGKRENELQEAVKEFSLSVEAAGAGFAAAVVMAERYRGNEISSWQALTDAGINVPSLEKTSGGGITEEKFEQALILCRSVHKTLSEQSASWKDRSVFERQWCIRTFRQKASMPVDEWFQVLKQLEAALQQKDTDTLKSINASLDYLAAYYAHLHEMAKGYIKDPAQREEQLGIIKNWQKEAEELSSLLK